MLVENLSLFALIYLCFSDSCRITCWESFIIRLDILIHRPAQPKAKLRIFHYSPWYTYTSPTRTKPHVENLSLFALIYLWAATHRTGRCWESFIIRLDILKIRSRSGTISLRIFHYSPWYTYAGIGAWCFGVENLSLFALIYLKGGHHATVRRWESFIIRLDILRTCAPPFRCMLRIFHYSPWYTYRAGYWRRYPGWESFIIRLDILKIQSSTGSAVLRIFHYSPWYT